MLAGPGMLAQSALIACCAVYILPYGWNWTESFLFGGILSATDPVAVIAILKVGTRRSMDEAPDTSSLSFAALR